MPEPTTDGLALRLRRLYPHASVGADGETWTAVREPAPVHQPLERTEFVFTVAASLLGWPAIVLPVASVDGLPVCAQIAAKSWDDARLLEAAALVE